MAKGGGKLSTMTMMLRALGIPGWGRMRRSAPRAARCCEAAPCPWGHIERLYGSAGGETRGREGWDVPGLSGALVHLSVQRGKKGVRNAQGDDCQRDERKDVGRHATVPGPRMSSQTRSSYQTVTFMTEMLGVRSWLQYNIAQMEPAVSGAEGRPRQRQRSAPAPEGPFCSHPQSVRTKYTM